MTPARATRGATPIDLSPARADDLVLASIRTAAGFLDDLERLRIAQANRVAAFEREYGVTAPGDILAALEHLKAAEHVAELQLKRIWRQHPLAPWVKGVPGCGEKLIARLIAVIGDPADRENPAKLWAYCGFGEPTRKRRAGMTQAELFRCGSPHAKKRAWLIGAQFVRTMGSPYRAVYDEARERYAGRDWTDGHKHQAAIRFVTKRFLLELWKEARAGRERGVTHSSAARAGHAPHATQGISARAGHSPAAAHTTHARAGQAMSDAHTSNARAGHPAADTHFDHARAGSEAAP